VPNRTWQQQLHRASLLDLLVESVHQRLAFQLEADAAFLSYLVDHVAICLALLITTLDCKRIDPCLRSWLSGSTAPESDDSTVIKNKT
jgi:hypothetical protein